MVPTNEISEKEAAIGGALHNRYSFLPAHGFLVPANEISEKEAAIGGALHNRYFFYRLSIILMLCND